MIAYILRKTNSFQFFVLLFSFSTRPMFQYGLNPLQTFEKIIDNCVLFLAIFVSCSNGFQKSCINTKMISFFCSSTGVINWKPCVGRCWSLCGSGSVKTSRPCNCFYFDLKALANEITLLRTHCCRHKCFTVCPRAQHLLRTQICSETFCVRNKCFPVSARKETSWATMFPRLPPPLAMMANYLDLRASKLSEIQWENFLWTLVYFQKKTYQKVRTVPIQVVPQVTVTTLFQYSSGSTKKKQSFSI